jgi:hypothetical protein
MKTFALALCLGCVAEAAFCGVAALFGRKGLVFPLERVTDAFIFFHFPGYLLGSLLELGNSLHAALAILFGVLQFTAVLWPVILLLKLLFRRDGRTGSGEGH